MNYLRVCVKVVIVGLALIEFCPCKSAAQVDLFAVTGSSFPLTDDSAKLLRVDAATGLVTSRLPLGSLGQVIRGMDFNSDGKLYGVTSTGSIGDIVLVDINTGEVGLVREGGQSPLEFRNARDIAFAPNGDAYVLSQPFGTSWLTKVNIDNGLPIPEGDPVELSVDGVPAGGFTTLAFNKNDGTLYADGSFEPFPGLHIINEDTGGSVLVPEYHGSGISANELDFGGDGVLRGLVCPVSTQFCTVQPESGESEPLYDVTTATVLAFASLQTQPGDFDDDGDVDGADFLNWQSDDGTESGLIFWESNYGATTSLVAESVKSIPEPSTAALGILCLCFANARIQLSRF